MAISLGLRFQILQREGFVCWNCGYRDSPLRICFLMPIWAGGGEEPSNLAAICRDCGGIEVDVIPAQESAAA